MAGQHETGTDDTADDSTHRNDLLIGDLIARCCQLLGQLVLVEGGAVDVGIAEVNSKAIRGEDAAAGNLHIRADEGDHFRAHVVGGQHAAFVVFGVRKEENLQY